MGKDESDSRAQGSSLMPESENVVRGSEQEHREVVGGFRSEEGCGGVAVNGDGFSENQGLADEGVANVVKNRKVLETNISVGSENDCQVLTDSEVNGMSSWLGMQGSDMNTVFSSDGAEKLDYDCASEKMDYMFASEMEEAADLSLDGSGGVVGGHGSDGGSSGEEGKYEDCDAENVTVASESRVAEVASLSVDSMVGVGAEHKIDRKESEDCDGNIRGIDSESRGAKTVVLSVDSLLGVHEDRDGNTLAVACVSRVPEAAVLSVDSLVGVDGQGRREEDISEDGGQDEDCDGNDVTIPAERRAEEAAVLSVDRLVGVGKDDRKEAEGGDEDCDENVVTITSESRVAKAAVSSVDSLVGVGGQDRKEGDIREEEGKDEDCDGDIVAVASESKVAEAAALSVDSLINVGGEDTPGEDCDGNIVTLASKSIVAEAADFSVDGSVGLAADDKIMEEECEDKGNTAVLSVDGSVAVDVEKRKDGGGSERVEKEEDCSGNIVAIEVPIAETSDHMDVDVKDLSDEGYGFAVGDFVWGQIESYPWWPGRIYDPSDASEVALKLKQKNRLLVAYFGRGTFAWCHLSQLKTFADNFDDMVKQSSCIDFVNAVQEAASEVGRLLSMKLSRLVDDKKTGSESTLPLARNSGIKEGVLVPETGVERLLYSHFEPAELLSHVNQIARIIDSGSSIMELEILKARLSAYYLSKRHKLPDFMDTQLVPGVEDSLMDETVAVDNSKSTVEAPTQGPFDELGHSPGLSGNLSNHVRKQKSIAEIMREDKDVHTANREVEAAVEMVNAIGSNGGKKRKGSEDGLTSKPVQKKKEVLLDSDEDVSSAELCAEENSFSIGSWMQSKEKKEDFDEGKSEERNRKGSLSRERKKSKYLSPPFTTPIRGQMEEIIEEAESFKVSRKVKASQAREVAAVLQYPPVYMGRLFDSSNYQTQEDDGEMVIDPKKIQAPVEEVLSQVHNAAISPQIRREGTSLDQFVDFTYAFRSSLYSEGSLCDLYEKNQPGRKRKRPESEEDGMLKYDHISSLKQNSGPKKKRKDTASGKETDENAPGAALVVSFWPGSSVPSRSDLISVYSKFGALNEAETDMFDNSYTARVYFLRTSDAENAFNHSQNNNPFGSSDVTFQLQYYSDGSKFGQHGERSKNKPLLAATPPPVSLSQGGEASRLIFIQKKLQGLTLILETSGDKSPDLMAKLQSEVKALLEDVNQMVEASLF